MLQGKVLVAFVVYLDILVITGRTLLQLSHLREAGLHQGLRNQAFTTTRPMGADLKAGESH